MDDRLEQARIGYEQAAFGGDPSGLTAAHALLDGLEADLALARGRLHHAALQSGADPSADGPDRERRQLERAVRLYQDLGDARGEAEARFWLGVYHQVVADDQVAALPHLQRALRLARETGDDMTTAYALRHLGIAAHRAGRLAEARDRLQESTRLRRSLRFWPGVAANLVGLAYLAAADGPDDEVVALLDEAERLATTSGADSVLAWVQEAQRALTHP